MGGHSMCPFDRADRESERIFEYLDSLRSKTWEEFAIQEVKKEYGVSQQIAEAQIRKWKNERFGNKKPQTPF